MASISDAIEQFILSVIGEDEAVRLSRNELANYFKVAPSQINYVLSTRFSLDKGYVIESKRGGGGFVTVIRLERGENPIAEAIADLEQIEYLTYNRACDIIDRLYGYGCLTESEATIVKSAVADRALSVPAGSAAGLRRNVLKEILLGILRR